MCVRDPRPCRGSYGPSVEAGADGVGEGCRRASQECGQALGPGCIQVPSLEELWPSGQ